MKSAQMKNFFQSPKKRTLKQVFDKNRFNRVDKLKEEEKAEVIKMKKNRLGISTLVKMKNLANYGTEG